VARGGPSAGFLLYATRAILRPPRPGGPQQGALVQGGLHLRHSDVAGHSAARGRHGGPRRRLPAIIRPGRQHDSLLHG